ncbi:hypothetical protein [Rhizobium sp. BK602]|uniref:hypothetical protein n=1 Tax=Rhizobium sp. BK602 TaxID=2586986 RepID=UPI00160A7BA7|nr:hypothetical protein [Rhizobium sp. BK602]MBB3608617.1 hypothetical protein [Rhizobium sp. BK602]
MATPAEIQKLERIRQDMAYIGRDWSIEADGAEIRLVFADPADGEFRLAATLAPDLPYAVQTFLVGAGDNLAFLLDMLDRCARAYREIASRQRQNKPKDYAAECAMKCQNDQAFRRFLIECHDMPDAADTERVKVKVRSLLAIHSMGELNDDPAAAARWDNLRKDFNQWKRL